MELLPAGFLRRSSWCGGGPTSMPCAAAPLAAAEVPHGPTLPPAVPGRSPLAELAQALVVRVDPSRLRADLPAEWPCCAAVAAPNSSGAKPGCCRCACTAEDRYVPIRQACFVGSSSFRKVHVKGAFFSVRRTIRDGLGLEAISGGPRQALVRCQIASTASLRATSRSSL